MKNFLKTLFFLVCAILVSCSEDEKVNSSYLNLSSSSVTLGADGIGQTVTISASSGWEITQIPEWLKVEPASGEAGEQTITFTATENTTETERKARLLLESGDNAQFITVVQGVHGELVIGQKEYIVMGGAASIVVSYASNFVPEVIIPQEASSWLSLVQSKAMTDRRLVLKVAENKDSLRIANVVLLDQSSNLSDTVLIKQYPQPKIELASSSHFMTYDETESVLTFPCNIPLDAKLSGNDSTWFSIKDNVLKNGQLSLTITCSRNEGKKVKETTLILENKDCGVSYNVALSQMFLANDGDAICLQTATYQPSMIVGSGYEYKKPTFIFTGDGFTKEDIETGVFDKYMREAYDGIFTTEPFKSLKNRFNAWILYAVSEDDGITTYEEYSKGEMRNTRFGVYFYDSSRGMRLSGDDGFSDVINYAKAKIEGQGGYYAPETGVVVVVAKTNVYGGTTLLDRTGRAVALCPLATSERNAFPRIVAHEAGGHGFGKLADEYYPGGGNISTSEKNGLLEWQKSDIYMNVSLEKDATKVPWSWLIGKSGYEDTGVFAGGYYYLGGVWRSSEMSIMKDLLVDPNFNDYSRFLIFERLYGIYDAVFPNMPGVKPVKEAFMEFDQQIVK